MRRVTRGMTAESAHRELVRAYKSEERARVAAYQFSIDLNSIPAKLCSKQIREAAEAAVVALNVLSTAFEEYAPQAVRDAHSSKPWRAEP